MVKLTPNEEKVRKELLKFPNGARATQLMYDLVMTKTPLYIALNRLEEKDLAFRGGHFLWYPNPPASIVADVSASPNGLSKQEDVSPAERYFQWRGTPEGGGNRFWAAMFPAIQKRRKKQIEDRPIYVPQKEPRRLSNHIPNPDEIDEANQPQKEK